MRSRGWRWQIAWTRTHPVTPTVPAVVMHQSRRARRGDDTRNLDGHDMLVNVAVEGAGCCLLINHQQSCRGDW